MGTCRTINTEGYTVVTNILGMDTNALLASDSGWEPHCTTMSMLGVHGVHFYRYIARYITDWFTKGKFNEFSHRIRSSIV